MKGGVVMLAGIDAGLAGVQAAVDVGAAWRQPSSPPLHTNLGHQDDTYFNVLDEAESKSLLAQNGIPVPSARVVHSAEEAIAAAEALRYPVVAKALGVAHKTEIGGVRLGLNSADEVLAAVMELFDLSDAILIEKMIEGVVAELIVGVTYDEQFGPNLTVGGGGTMVELMKDSASLLIPTTRERVLHALGRLNCASLFNGFRGAPPADLKAAADVVLAVAGMVEDGPTSIVELDINPLMLLAEGQGVVAADALIILSAEPVGDPAEVSEMERENLNE
jgi:acetyl-CoA synthetase